MIETHLIAAALGGSSVLVAAKLFAFRLKSFAQLPDLPSRQLPPPLPVRKSTETIAQSKPLAVEKPVQLPPKLPEIERTIAPIVVRPEKAVQLLIKYLQDSKCTGVFASSEIDEFWDMAAKALNLDHIPYGTIRSQLAGIPGAFLGRKSLAIEYREVRRRTGKGRAVLYRIPDRGKAVAGKASQDQAVHPAAMPLACQRPAIDEKPSQARRAA